MIDSYRYWLIYGLYTLYTLSAKVCPVHKKMLSIWLPVINAICNMLGSTSTEFKVRFRNHKSSTRNDRRTCELARELACELAHSKIHLILTDYYSLEKPIGQHNCLH